MRLDPDYIRIETTAAAAHRPREAVDNQFDSVDESADAGVDKHSSVPLASDVLRVTSGGYLTCRCADDRTRRADGKGWLRAEHRGLRRRPAAYEILILLPDTEPLNTVAIAELHAAGIAGPTARRIAVRAARHHHPAHGPR
jgi:hypothetical protein